MNDNTRTLELQLERLGSALAYPSTPDIASRIRARIAEQEESKTRPSGWGLAGAALAAVVVALSVVLAVASPAQEAVADLFDRIIIFETDDIAENLPPDFRGDVVTLDEAEQRLGRQIVVPYTTDGAPLSPSRVIYHDFSPTNARAVSLSFETPDGTPYAIFETASGLGKGLGDGASVEPVSSLGDGEAYWLQGQRIVQIYDENGDFTRESQREADANTLVWMPDGFVLRLEGDVSKTEAIEIAKSVR